MSTYINSHEEIFEYAKKVKPIDGFEDVFIYGSATGFSINDADGKICDQYTQREFAEMLRNDLNYHGGYIRLCSCDTGADDAMAAKALAWQLGVDVYAPSDLLWIHFDGKMTIGPDEFTDTGKWVLYERRKKT